MTSAGSDANLCANSSLKLMRSLILTSQLYFFSSAFSLNWSLLIFQHASVRIR